MSMKYLNWMYTNIPYKYLTPGEQSVLTALAIRYNDNPDKHDDKPKCFPSMTQLQRMTQLSESGIDKIKVSLKLLGFIRWKTGGRGGGKRNANEYELLYPPVKGQPRPAFDPDSLALEAKGRRNERNAYIERCRKRKAEKAAAKTGTAKPVAAPSSVSGSDNVRNAPYEIECEKRISMVLAESVDSDINAVLEKLFDYLTECRALPSEIMRIYEDIMAYPELADEFFAAMRRVLAMVERGTPPSHPVPYVHEAMRKVILDHLEEP